MPTIRLSVTKGSVKWFPTGSHRDAPFKILKEGESVELASNLSGPNLDATDDRVLRDILKKQVDLTAAAPAVGSASTPEGGNLDGLFKIETDAVPLLVRHYYAGTQWREVLVKRGAPFETATLEGNAVTAALYGVHVAKA